jgi:aryl-alcohol dehydrogenase-like predicted oxidoreductase
MPETGHVRRRPTMQKLIDLYQIHRWDPLTK